MSKKCMINRNNKRIALGTKFFQKRKKIKIALKQEKGNLDAVFLLYQELASLPRASSKTRVKSRCFITGRSRGNYKRFGLCRNEVRRLVSFAEVTGVRKSSW